MAVIRARGEDILGGGLTDRGGYIFGGGDYQVYFSLSPLSGIGGNVKYISLLRPIIGGLFVSSFCNGQSSAVACLVPICMPASWQVLVYGQ